MRLNLYLLKLPDERPSYFHADTPYHPVRLICNRQVAKWCLDWTGAGAWMWESQNAEVLHGAGWLITAWNGLLINYGHVVRGGELPDGTPMGIWHPHKPEVSLPWDLLKRAVWWSSKPMPATVGSKLGVPLVIPDQRTREQIHWGERSTVG